MNKRFKLEKILDFRNKVLDREKMKLTDLNNNERMLVIRLVEIRDEIELKHSERAADELRGEFTFSTLYNKYISVKEKEYVQIELMRVELLKKIEEQKIVVGKALNDVKIMERLKEKHLLEYVKYMNKQEALQIDEINITRRREQEN